MREEKAFMLMREGKHNGETIMGETINGETINGETINGEAIMERQ